MIDRICGFDSYSVSSEDRYILNSFIKNLKKNFHPYSKLKITSNNNFYFDLTKKDSHTEYKKHSKLIYKSNFKYIDFNLNENGCAVYNDLCDCFNKPVIFYNKEIKKLEDNKKNLINKLKQMEKIDHNINIKNNIKNNIKKEMCKIGKEMAALKALLSSAIFRKKCFQTR